MAASRSPYDDQGRVSVLTATVDSLLIVFVSRRFNVHKGQAFDQLLPDAEIHGEMLCALSESPVLPLMSTDTERLHPEAEKRAVAPNSWPSLEQCCHHQPPQPAAQEHGSEGHFINISLYTF